MLNKEGPKNLFQILQSCDIDMDSLQGILIDHACFVDPYILNKEADTLEWKLLIVDGALEWDEKTLETIHIWKARAHWVRIYFQLDLFIQLMYYIVTKQL